MNLYCYVTLLFPSKKSELVQSFIVYSHSFCHPRSGVVIVLVAHVCMSVCLYVCNTIIFESLDVKSAFSAHRYIFRGWRLSASSYRKVTVKVTAAKNMKFCIPAMWRRTDSQLAITPVL